MILILWKHKSSSCITLDEQCILIVIFKRMYRPPGLVARPIGLVFSSSWFSETNQTAHEALKMRHDSSSVTWACIKDHMYRMVIVKYSNIWPNQTIVSDQSELTILLCQPMIIYVCSEDDVNWVQRPSTFHILYTWSLVSACVQVMPEERPN